MAATINVNHVKEVFSDEAFVKELLAMESPEEAQAALKAKGVEISIEELEGINVMLVAKLSESGELSLDDLDNAAGGVVTAAVIGGVALLGLLGVLGGSMVIAGAVTRRW